jgi:hypothetical protein
VKVFFFLKLNRTSVHKLTEECSPTLLKCLDATEGGWVAAIAARKVEGPLVEWADVECYWYATEGPKHRQNTECSTPNAGNY